jgi:hypothetical protein
VPVTPPRLAVDLSSGLIRVVEGSMGGPMRCGSGGTPAGALEGGRILNSAAVAAAVRQLLARTEITETRAYLALSDSVATFRVLKLPASSGDQDVNAAVAKELPLDPERLATRWMDVIGSGDQRVVFAVAWDRSIVKSATEAARMAGLEAVVVDLKSACLARAVAEPSCIIADLSSDPAEIVLVDGHLPQVWHSLTFKAGTDMVAPLASAMRSVIRFYRRRRDGEFGSRSPVLIAGEQLLPSEVVTRLSEQLGQPVFPLPLPARVPPDVRHATYLTCLGLIMRRGA